MLGIFYFNIFFWFFPFDFLKISDTDYYETSWPFVTFSFGARLSSTNKKAEYYGLTQHRLKAVKTAKKRKKKMFPYKKIRKK